LKIRILYRNCQTPGVAPATYLNGDRIKTAVSLLPQFPCTKKPGFGILKARLEKPSLLLPERDIEQS